MSDEPFSTIPDADLVALALQGDQEAYATLVRRAIPMATGVVRRMVRDESVTAELVHRATVEAYVSLVELRDPAGFRSWLAGIASNLARRYLRSVRHEVLSLESLAGGVRFEALFGPVAASDPALAAEEAEIDAELNNAIASLPESSREVAAMYYQQELRTSEIAQKLGISDGTARVRLSRARERLRQHFADSGLINVPPGGRRRKEPDVIRVEVADVIEQDLTEAPEGGPRTACVVILHDERGRRVLPVWVGVSEGTAIALALLGVVPPRPLTHLFAATLIQAAGAKMDEARITRLDGGTFIATVLMNVGEEKALEVDSRPSDAINLALTMGRPVLVAEDVMGSCGLQVEEGALVRKGDGARQLVEKLRWWLKPGASSRAADPERAEMARARLRELIFTPAP